MLPRLSLPLAALLTLSAGPLFAADSMPLGSLDARSTGPVSSGDTQRAGTMTSAMRFEGNQASATDTDLQPASGEDKTVLRDANRASLFLGAALTSSMELSLGIHGTFEHVRPQDRDQLFPDGSGGSGSSASAVTWRENLKETGFATASLMLKMKLLDAQGLKFALAPFIESGAGEQATYSLTRSVSPKAGWMAITSYGSEGVAEVSLNGGYRYREPEAMGDLTLRNEMFYRAALKAYASRDFALFVAGDARKIMVARNDELDADGKLSYKPFESGQALGGFEVKAGDAELQAFYGARASKGKGFSGFGEQSFGASIAWTLGNYKGSRLSRDSVGADIQKDLADQDAKAADAAAKKVKAQPVKAETGDDYPEMIGKDIDPLDALGKDDSGDFKDAKKRMDQNQKDAAVETEDERIEKELKQIKDVEEKADKEREAQEKTEKDAARREAVKDATEDDQLMKEWMDEAKGSNEDGTITHDEMEWNGLE